MVRLWLTLIGRIWRAGGRAKNKIGTLCDGRGQAHGFALYLALSLAVARLTEWMEGGPMTEFAPGLHAATGQNVDVSAYDRFVGRWSRLFVPAVIAAAEIGPGCKVLDICTGTGEAAVATLPVIGPSGILVGADISPEMLKAARERVNHHGFWPIATDGQALAFRDGCFDAVICQLGLQFFPDPARGLTEFRRVLRPGGKASVCVISTPDRAPMWGILAETVGRYLPEKRGILMSSFSLADARRFEDLFKGAGFTNVCVVRDVRAATVESFEEYWESIEAGIGSIPQSYLLLPETDRRAVREEVKAKLSRFVVDGNLHMSVETLIGSGQADQESTSAGLR
jgi:ubiquinone/menaquinone biosynthesis C-methylase UbiE